MATRLPLQLTFSQAAESKSLTLSSLVGVGRSARGLHVEWERTCLGPAGDW
jgi:hypothetical protein